MDKAKIGCFRDPYNTYGLFNFLRCNLADEWEWVKLRQQSEWFDKSGLMTINGAMQFLTLLSEAKTDLDRKGEYTLKEDDTTEIAGIMRDVMADNPGLSFVEGGSGDLPQGVKYMTLTRREARQFFERLGALIYFVKESIRQKVRIVWDV